MFVMMPVRLVFTESRGDICHGHLARVCCEREREAEEEICLREKWRCGGGGRSCDSICTVDQKHCEPIASERSLLAATTNSSSGNSSGSADNCGRAAAATAANGEAREHDGGAKWSLQLAKEEKISATDASKNAAQVCTGKHSGGGIGIPESQQAGYFDLTSSHKEEEENMEMGYDEEEREFQTSTPLHNRYYARNKSNTKRSSLASVKTPTTTISTNNNNTVLNSRDQLIEELQKSLSQVAFENEELKHELNQARRDVEELATENQQLYQENQQLYQENQQKDITRQKMGEKLAFVTQAAFTLCDKLGALKCRYYEEKNNAWLIGSAAKK